MKVLVDADLILVAYLNLGYWEKEVEFLWDMIGSCKIEAYITECGLAKISHIVTKILGREMAEEVSLEIADILKILPSDETLYKQARRLNLLDFHSALEIVTATANNLECVLTLTSTNFITSRIKVVSITDLYRQSLESRIVFLGEHGYDQDLDDITILSQWLQNQFDSGDSDWYPVESSLNNFACRSSNSFFNSSIKR
ncbi:MAG: type II toxin-antitoxin system VapC family toxin [Sphaerospermopsis sp. SIO1G2]|nr:type II toxin-antitoxin system VapC family toxin [Sphaerospermopsis sp. SIO1G1]NET72984.1 type II toxin-antitoxin system VapC family toxin [Sphaerospermopsis sp. SIO1G2]